MKNVLTVFFLLFLTTNSFSQIKLISTVDNYLVGEIRNKYASSRDFFGKEISDYDFVVSLSYSKTLKGDLYILKFRDELAKQFGLNNEINFYATDKDIDILYNIILNDFSKTPGEFETILKLGDQTIKITTSLIHPPAGSGSNSHYLSFINKGVVLFTLNKEEVKKLFNR